MRKSFLAVLLVLILALPLSVLAKEIELSPVPINGLGTEGHFYPLLPLLPAEQELYNDNGSPNYYFPYPSSIVTTITIPYNCWLVRPKAYLAGGSTGNESMDVFSDSGGWPTWTSLIGGPVNIYFSGQGWCLSADFSSPIWFNSGTVTHPGQLSGDPNWNFGICTDNNYSGSGGCFYGYSGYWYGDYTAYFGHTMARLIVNDDVTPPYADTFNPPDGGTGQPNTTIVFHVRDATGVDSSSIGFTAEDESKGDVSGTLDIDDSNLLDVICTFTPDDDLPVGDTITCTVSEGLADILGNVNQSSFNWNFDVAPYTKLQPTSLGHIKAQYN
jgi:hypothetical protein